MQNKTYSFYRSESNPYIPTGDWKKEAESTLRFEIYEKIGNGYSISYLEDLGIVNGRFGLSLDGSTIDNTYGGSVDLTLNYRIRVVNLPFFEGAGIDINMEQHACTKLW